MLIANFSTGLICVLLGAILSSGNASNMVAGYNTLPKEEKDKYDAVRISKFAGRQCLIVGAIMILSGLLMLYWPYDWIGTVGWILFLIIIIGGIVYANGYKRFMKN